MDDLNAKANDFLARLILACALGFVLFIAIAFVLHITMPPLAVLFGSHMFIAWVICSGVTGMLLRNVKLPSFGQSKAPPGDFVTTFKHENIKLDAENNQLWVKPMLGKPMMIPRDDILAWEHEWVDTRNAMGMLFHVKNRIVLRIRNLEKPTVTVNFSRAHLTAKEWQARLTNWINH
jgi:hypothetical protein